jgi:hypothetical protein
MLTLETLRKYADAIYDNFTELDRRMVALETAERRKTVRAKRPVQHRKGETVRCSDCRRDNCPTSDILKISNGGCFQPKRTASPVA